MRKIYRLEGLDCANCAMKIENAIQKVQGINHASVDFLSTKLTIETENMQASQIEADTKKVIQRIEPTVKLIPFSRIEDTTKKNHTFSPFIRIILTAIFFIILSYSPFVLNKEINFLCYFTLYLFIGSNVIKKAVINCFHGEIFDENFLMLVATFGAFFIKEYPEAIAVMLFYQIGEWVQQLAVNHSKESIESLMNLRPDKANLIVKNDIRVVSPETIKIKDKILVKPGEKVPLDGKVISGEGLVDTSALTGESVPRTLKPGAEILSGFINKNSALTIEVTKGFNDSTASKLLELMEEASDKKANTENFITKFAHYYTPIVVFSAVLLAVVPPILLTNANFYVWLSRALTFLVISCPCALVISVPLSFFGGIGGASKLGILIKGSNYLEILAKTDTIVFDKTGTLTEGVFEVQKIESPCLPKEELLRLAVIAEQNSIHPIALSLKKSYPNKVPTASEIEELSGYGIKAKIEGKLIYIGNEQLMKQQKIALPTISELRTVLFMAIDGQYAGYFVISDRLKKNVKETIQSLRTLGIQNIMMLTGDNQKIAQKTAQTLQLDKIYAELLPKDKVDCIEQFMKKKPAEKKVAFVGDGMNDAPVLARADIGIAMGGLGSDASIEAADMVIMNDEPGKIISAIQLARRTLKIAKQNIAFAIGIKLLVLLLSTIGLTSMSTAIFADVGVTILAVLNAMRCLQINKLVRNKDK
ncbi:heavy metal translocating P-type ATPase [Melissococcus plutonius]|uniref:heavy metal translocating P-type ATPase n=1 Tax=Melissococcus plutonius TaxID=33970 RepID=UPI003C2D8564